MKNKSETLDMFKTYVNKIKNQFSKNSKRFYSDKGIVYNYSLFNEFYKNHRSVHEAVVHIILK